MQRYVVAVSGGVDSVVLLDMLAKAPDTELVVAHFDHGIREESAEDTAFVRSLARAYDVPFETERIALGATASEDRARRVRYDFLHRTAKKHHARIATAHHADDVLETIIINIIRGTGWRGVASLRETPEIARPLLDYRKKELLDYAHQHNLHWREDATNIQTHYLRNYIRHHIMPRLGTPFETKLLELHTAQVAVRAEIEQTTQHILALEENGSGYPRYPFIMLEPSVARELLRTAIENVHHKSPTQPQLHRALLAIKTYRPHTQHQINHASTLRFTKDRFMLL